QVYIEKIPVLLSLQDIEIEGCAAACTNADGGIIWTNEPLSLSNVVLQGGRASARGGAIYAGQDGIVEIKNSLLRDNQAPKGGAVYLVRNALRMSQSLVTANSATSVPDGAVIQVESATGPSATITNSTLSGNTVGLALSLREDAIVNSSTIVANAGGIDFNGEEVRVFNTILAGNGANDCVGTLTEAVMKNNLVVAGACLDDDNSVISNSGQLMAGLDAGGRCSGASGLLCPLAKHGDDKLESHLPRVLIGYVTIAESPLINKGGLNIQAGSIGECPGDDQRGKTRNDTLCDIGAVQLQALTGSVRAGDAIRFNQTYTPTRDDYLGLLGDEELLPASECPGTPPTPAAGSSYRDDLPGCPWLEVLPERGVVTFNPDGTYTYVPNANFHGFDPFTIRVMTTVSRLNSQPINQSRVLSAQVIMEPTSGISTDSLGGAVGLGGLFMLLLGGWSVRRVRGVSL
ncbi:MAG: Ig-like domain-containing protein, partial [Moraxellaceae bacterium]|nr:Ig-like domain-containing protein [Moraxellaceae bacterium]